MLDMQELNKGIFYDDLSRSYIIFICTFDLFGEGRHKYTFEHRCAEDLNLELGDETQKIFLNTAGIRDDVSPELKVFLDYIKNGKAQDAYTERIDQEIGKAKANREWRRAFMTLEMREREIERREFKRGEESGRKQGELAGRSLNQEENFLNALRNGVDPKLAQKIVAISDETAERLLNRFRSGKTN